MGELDTSFVREAVRGPMQWDAGRNGGFSTARASRLTRPLPTGGYGPEHVNVNDQRRDPDSLWMFISELISRYRSTPVIPWGRLKVLDSGDRRVLAHECSSDEVTFLAVHNFSPEPVTVELPGWDAGREITVLLDSSGHTAPDLAAPDEAGRVRLDGYGFRWLKSAPPPTDHD